MINCHTFPSNALFAILSSFSNDFENNLKNLKGTFAVEIMTFSEEGVKNLKRIDSGKVSYTDVIEELKLKYMQRV